MMMQSPLDKKQEIHTYVAQWAVYTLAWTTRLDKRNRIAVGSFLEDYNNKVELINFNSNTNNFNTTDRLHFDHPYTPTNLQFLPSESTSHNDLLATSGDYLRLWQINSNSNSIKLKTTLTTTTIKPSPSSPTPSTAITSFDWSPFTPNQIATSHIDTTCTIWDIDNESIDTQLVAHDKPVHDISWGGHGVFTSVSADGSVRIFDLRDKERSTIIYESKDTTPIMRVEWCKADPRYIAAVEMDSYGIVILDIRFPTAPVAELKRHKGCVNGVTWSTISGRYLCSVGDDSRVLIWDVVKGGECDVSNEQGFDPVMWYGLSSEVSNVKWCPVESDWIAIAFLNKVQLLKV